METTDIEKKSLEAHVELCATRYKFLEVQLVSVNEKIEKLEMLVTEVRDVLDTAVTDRNKQLISWGTAIICSLIGALAYMVTHYIFK